MITIIVMLSYILIFDLYRTSILLPNQNYIYTIISMLMRYFFLGGGEGRKSDFLYVVPTKTYSSNVSNFERIFNFYFS